MSGWRAKVLTRSSLVAGVAALASALSAQAPASPPTSDGSMLPSRSARNANYTIEARLDAGARSITGREVIAWRNTSSNSTDELQFHLYWNAWRDTRSTFMRELPDAGDPT